MNRNFIGIAELTTPQLKTILSLAQDISMDISNYANKLQAKNIAAMFYEPSTRTRSSFQLAAHRLGANFINLDPASSSMEKGESFLDTCIALESMGMDLIIVRHGDENMLHPLTKVVNIPIVNAGDGKNEHPSQALLDILTISLTCGDIKDLKIVMVGDIIHSRVANSFMAAVEKLGCGELCLVGPPELLMDDNKKGIKIERDMDKAVVDADIIIMLRMQLERMSTAEKAKAISYINISADGLIHAEGRDQAVRSAVDVPEEARGYTEASPEIFKGQSYFDSYGLSMERLKLAKKDVVVMHPGPLNRGVEISSAVADSAQSLIFKQVEYGVYARMAIFMALLDDQAARKLWG